MSKFDHQEAAFYVAITCFWTVCSFAIRRFPSLNIFYTQNPLAEVRIPLWRDRIPQFIGLVFWVSYVAYLSHFHWTMTETEATLAWLAMFALVALLALLVTRLFIWAFRRMTATQESSR